MHCLGNAVLLRAQSVQQLPVHQYPYAGSGNKRQHQIPELIAQGNGIHLPGGKIELSCDIAAGFKGQGFDCVERNTKRLKRQQQGYLKDI